MRKKFSMQTIDIPCDETIKWNDIKKAKKLRFKMVDNPDLIEILMTESNAQLLNQAEGSPFIVEPLATLIGKEIFTSFSEEILKGIVNLSTINHTLTKRHI